MKKLICRLLTVFYRLGLWVSQGSYQAVPFRMRKVKAKVISVGNITWGGTGKTPLVIKLAQDLVFYGKKVAVLTRGYGADEVAELKKKLPNVPVLIGRDRVRSARQAVAKHQAEYLILDDGFQHLRLRRDLDIVNINSLEPFGPGGLIPLGTMREPMSHLSRAQVFVLTKSNLGAKNVPAIRQKILAIRPDAQIFEAVHRPMRFTDPVKNRALPLHEIKNRKVATLSGIADPLSFEKTVEILGAEILFAARFDDHHVYTAKEVSDFFAECRRLGARDVVTTEKDYCRLEPLIKNMSDPGALNFLVLEIEFQVSDEEPFIRRCLNP